MNKYTYTDNKENNKENNKVIYSTYANDILEADTHFQKVYPSINLIKTPSIAVSIEYSSRCK